MADEQRLPADAGGLSMAGEQRLSADARGLSMAGKQRLPADARELSMAGERRLSADARGLSMAGEQRLSADARGLSMAGERRLSTDDRGVIPGGEGRPNVLVIAGYDQSGGAGVLADIKTLEAHGVYGYAVCTAMTFQNERVISRVEWLPEAAVFEQIDLCFASAHFDWVKIGITSSMGSAAAILRHVRGHHSGVRVVLDPVVRASSGTAFWAGGPVADRGTADESRAWEELVAGCYLLTPNREEMEWLYPGHDAEERCSALSKRGSSIYLKGGHHPAFPGRDLLFSGGEVQVMNAEHTPVYPKHGSGCVLASSLTAGLALGYPLPVAAVRAKRYTAQFLTSNQSLLGWHRWNDCIS